MMEDTSKKSGDHAEQKSQKEKTLSRRSSAAEMNLSCEAQVSVFEELHAADKAESTTSDGTRTKKTTTNKLKIVHLFFFFLCFF